MFQRASGWGGAMKMEISSWFTNMGHAAISKELFDLVKSIGESKSKQEEDVIITKEIKLLRSTIGSAETLKRMREVLIRLIYCEMLGHDVSSFGYVHAINASQMGNTIDRRVGYLASSLFLHESHRFMLLLINSIRKDLAQDNTRKDLLDNTADLSAALSTVCKLVGKDYIPAVLAKVIDLLNHPKDLVRKKAVMALHRCLTRDPEAVADLNEKFRRALCDKDPSVMMASLQIFHDLVQKDPSTHKDLIPSFVSILKQVIEHRLPRDYDYHRIPAPWVQIKLLQILASLGKDDQKGSEHMYDILSDTMKRADTGINAGSAVVYECVRAITTIYPHAPLLDAAANSISRFIKSDQHNLKYLGINTLALIVQINPRYASEHQLTVIEALEDPDETIRRRTLDLLYKMTNSKNVKVIAEKMIAFLRNTADSYLRTELVSRLTQMAEKWAPDSEWFLETMTNIFILGGDLVRREVPHLLIRLIAEGAGDDPDLDDELRCFAVKKFMACIDELHMRLPDILIEVASWVIGEYSYMVEMTPQEVLNKLEDLAERHYDNPETRGWILTAIMKVLPRHIEVQGSCPQNIRLLLEKYKASASVDVQQRCYEIEQLLSLGLDTMQASLPEDASCEDVQIDIKMPFLDDYVRQAIRAGGALYKPPHERQDLTLNQPTTNEVRQQRKLIWEAYEAPSSAHNLLPLPSTAPIPTVEAAPVPTTLQLNVGQKKWTKSGFVLPPSSALTREIGQEAPPLAGYKAAEISPGERSPRSSSPQRIAPRSADADRRHEEQKKKVLEAHNLFGIDDGRPSPPSGSFGAKGKTPAKKAAAAAVAPNRSATVAKKVAARSRPPASAPPPAAPEPVIAASPVTPAVVSVRKASRGSAVARPPIQAQPAPPMPSPQPTQTEALIDLLGFDSPSPATQHAVVSPSPPTKTASASSMGTDLDLLMDFGSRSSPAPANRAAPIAQITQPVFSSNPKQPAAASPIDLLSPMQGLVLAKDLDLANMPLPAWAVQVTENHPKSSSTLRPLINEGDLRVAHNKVYRPDGELIVVLMALNASDQAMENFILKLSLPTNLKCTVQSDPQQCVVNGSDVQIRQLAARQVLVLLVRMRFESSHAINMVVSGVVQVPRGKLVNFSVPVDITDLLRKSPITVDLFAKNWAAHKCEKKHNLPGSTIGSPQELTARFDKLNLAPIQVKGNEAVIAAKLPTSAGDRLCLIHARLDPQTRALDITVRTQETFFTDVVHRFFAISFK